MFNFLAASFFCGVLAHTCQSAAGQLQRRQTTTTTEKGFFWFLVFALLCLAFFFFFFFWLSRGAFTHRQAVGNEQRQVDEHTVCVAGALGELIVAEEDIRLERVQGLVDYVRLLRVGRGCGAAHRRLERQQVHVAEHLVVARVEGGVVGL